MVGVITIFEVMSVNDVMMVAESDMCGTIVLILHDPIPNLM